ncbi:MAG: hypothetical protein KDB74_03715 [Flavobacteriales bacterium]|nr:hypothetical protein [Flavobacteriales bacterium]
MKLSQILDYLKDENIPFHVVHEMELDVSPANFKKFIENGIYHITSGFNGDLNSIKNSVIICDQELENENTQLIVDNPQLVHYMVVGLFKEKQVNSIHPTAIIHPKAKIGQNVHIGEYSIVKEAIIEDNVRIESHVVIYNKVHIKKGTFIDSNSCIGPGGLVWVWNDKGERIVQPQIGGVIIEEDCHLGTDITIVRGSLAEDTRIGRGTVIAHGSKIGHGSDIGEMVHMANNISIAGNTVIGNRSFFGSGSVVPPNVKIPANTVIGAGAMVNKNFKEEYLTLVGVPAKILYKENFKSKGKGTPVPFKKN